MCMGATSSGTLANQLPPSNGALPLNSLPPKTQEKGESYGEASLNAALATSKARVSSGTFQRRISIAFSAVRAS